MDAQEEYTLRRFALAVLAGVVFTVCVAAVGSQCACGPGQRKQTIEEVRGHAAVSIASLASAYQKWDHEKQHRILEESSSLEEYEARITGYREGQARVRAAIRAAVALLELEKADAGSLLKAAADLQAAIRDVTGGGP